MTDFCSAAFSIIYFTQALSIFLNFLASVAKMTEISPSVKTLSKFVHKIYTFTHKSKVL